MSTDSPTIPEQWLAELTARRYPIAADVPIELRPLWERLKAESEHIGLRLTGECLDRWIGEWVAAGENEAEMRALIAWRQSWNEVVYE